MRIRIGYELVFDCLQETPFLAMLRVHPSRSADLLTPDVLECDPGLPVTEYRDAFDNICSRFTAPPGRLTLRTQALVNDTGVLDVTAPEAEQTLVQDLPSEVLVYLMGSRYCETDLLSETAWRLFGSVPPGWARAQAIRDFVHQHITFGYQYARSTRTALEGFQDRCGVCRDFTHLAVALSRCMNIPARYCTGYLGDIGVPLSDSPMDFSAWYEVYIDNTWYTLDARHGAARIGRIVMGRGRDATDVALTNCFGQASLIQFTVFTDEVSETDV